MSIGGFCAMSCGNGGFPRDLVLKNGDTYIYNWDVIRELTQE